MKYNIQSSYSNRFGMLNSSGNIAFCTSCKEEFASAIGKYFAYKRHDIAMHRIMGPRVITGTIDKKDPRFIIWVEQAKAEIIADRISTVMALLCNKMNLSPPMVELIVGTNAVVVGLDPFFISTPLAVSFALTFIRGASRTNFVFNCLNNFISKLISRPSDYHYTNPDGFHLKRAKEHGTLDGFLNRNLKTFNNKEFDAFKKIRHPPEPHYKQFFLPLVATYDDAAEEGYPLVELDKLEEFHW